MSRTKVLFVDDEPNLLEGLKRMLRPQRTEWDMDFAPNASEALVKMSGAHFDVVVTDLLMPGVNGAELLERVIKSHPDTVRIVLCGHADENLTKRAMKVAHQYLNKPTDADQLREAIAKASGAKTMVGDDRLRKAIASCDTLPSMPSLYSAITRAVESQTANSKTIAGIISKDMAMSAKLLQLVNSSFFGIGRRVSSIEQTVSLLGVVRIKALVLQESIVKLFVPSKELAHFEVTEFWRHSMLVGELARMLAQAEKQEGDRPDQAFTAGIMHDIGKLILAARETEHYEKVLATAHMGNERIEDTESRMMGITHSEVGAYLLRLWSLPERIVEAVACHHQPSRLEYDGICALSVVHVADLLERNARRRQTSPEAVDSEPLVPDMAYLERIGRAGRLAEWTRLVEEKCQKYVEQEA